MLVRLSDGKVGFEKNEGIECADQWWVPRDEDYEWLEHSLWNWVDVFEDEFVRGGSEIA
jgi:hypothetical protein